MKTNTRLALHYHVPAFIENEQFKTHGFFGVFIDSIAPYFSEICYFAYSPPISERKKLDYTLSAENVSIYNLGEGGKFGYLKFIYNFGLRRGFIEKLNQFDIILLRAPTALSFIVRRTTLPTALLIVGEFPSTEQLNKLSILSNVYNRVLYRWMKIHQNALARKSLIFANNDISYQSALMFSDNVVRIVTSSFSNDQIYVRSNQKLNDIVKLLFVGRIEESKGLNEMIACLRILNSNNPRFHLTIVGWSSSEAYLNELKSLVDKEGQIENVRFAGYIGLGSKLFDIYRNHDIFVMPTKFDAFPRTITEAFSQSLPVIATKVGGIPDRLTSHVNSILIEPGNSKELSEAIKELSANEELRNRLVSNALTIASESTLDSQAHALSDEIIKYLASLQ